MLAGKFGHFLHSSSKVNFKVKYYFSTNEARSKCNTSISCDFDGVIHFFQWNPRWPPLRTFLPISSILGDYSFLKIIALVRFLLRIQCFFDVSYRFFSAEFKSDGC